MSSYSWRIHKQHDSKFTIMLQVWSNIVVTLVVTQWTNTEPLYPAGQGSMCRSEELSPVLNEGESNAPQDSGDGVGLINALGNCSLSATPVLMHNSFCSSISGWPLTATPISIICTQKKARQKSMGAQKLIVVWLLVDQDPAVLQPPLKSRFGCCQQLPVTWDPFELNCQGHSPKAKVLKCSPVTRQGWYKYFSGCWAWWRADNDTENMPPPTWRPG